LRNLIGILAGKLDLFASLPVFEYEAAVEGNETFAAAFHRLAEHERRSFDDLLECLRVHLNETTAALGEADADDAASDTAACG
jgi:hypothetical protein